MIPCRFNLSGLTFSGLCAALDLPVLPKKGDIIYFHDATDTKLTPPSGEYTVENITLFLNKRDEPTPKYGNGIRFFYIIDATLTKQDDEGREGRMK